MYRALSHAQTGAWGGQRGQAASVQLGGPLRLGTTSTAEAEASPEDCDDEALEHG
eukprot:CAMPEP_0179062284 /NCGR_PEP_ID=MMETSP0796-20121207/26850_1 /TAXON_ID=73915 /ORGANISM="Pyrodinium bahamense, Strain pbaha01" /LENGTH=54 /DNA_ID=CAMNT_0020759189 /DNA_START=282 /DNA_END=442 /DNA_ORIENTATION=-